MLKKKTFLSLIFCIGMISLTAAQSVDQEAEKILKEGTIKEQLQFLYDNSRTYINNKVVRIKWLEEVQTNMLERENELLSISKGKDQEISALQKQIDQIQTELESTEANLAETQTKVDNFNFLGSDISKGSFTIIFWSVSGILLALLLFALYKLRGNSSATKEAKERLAELEDQFEDLRKKKREKEQELMRKLQDEINKHS